MGMTFSNLHIRKNETFDLNKLKNLVTQNMSEKGYQLLETADGAESSVFIYAPEDSKWISVACDEFEFWTYENTKAVAGPFSRVLGTDVLAAGCMDSDCLLLNLVNEEDNTDARIGTGFMDDIQMETPVDFDVWEKKIRDMKQFKEILKSEPTFAEDILYDMAEKVFEMSADQCVLETGYSEDLDQKALIKMYFSMPEDSQKEPPKLEIHSFSLMPCKIGESNCVFATNKGGSSRGVAIYFAGDFIENDELTFEDITFEYDFGSDERQSIPITPKKMKAVNGEYILYWEDKNFQIPAKVNPNLSLMRQEDLEWKRMFGVRFTVQGNPRKLLDVKVFIIPLEKYDSEAAACWYVWKTYGSKEKYIESHNRTWKELDSPELIYSLSDSQ